MVVGLNLSWQGIKRKAVYSVVDRDLGCKIFLIGF